MRNPHMKKQCTFSLFSCSVKYNSDDVEALEGNANQIQLNFFDGSQIVENNAKKQPTTNKFKKSNKNCDKIYKSTMQSSNVGFSKQIEESSFKNNTHKDSSRDHGRNNKVHYRSQNNKISLKNKTHPQRESSSLHYIVSDINKSWQSNPHLYLSHEDQQNILSVENVPTYVTIKNQNQQHKKQIGIQCQQNFSGNNQSLELKDISFSKNRNLLNHGHQHSRHANKQNYQSGSQKQSYMPFRENNCRAFTMKPETYESRSVVPYEALQFKKKQSNQANRSSLYGSGKVNNKGHEIYSTGLYSNLGLSSGIKSPSILMNSPCPSNHQASSNGFRTLADISRNVQSQNDEQTSSEHISLAMSPTDNIIQNNSSSSDGSRLYRTIKRLTSKSISNGYW